jgi:phosphohistidine swiveling domain-containing protein
VLREPVRADLPEGALGGVAASAGVAEGVARVVLDPGVEVLRAGEILVAPYTDPGWTPLFTHAAGLVTEVGGLMTHGSVVAREMGIPAVVARARRDDPHPDGRSGPGRRGSRVGRGASVTLVIRAERGRVVTALARIAGLAPGPGPVRLRVRGDWVAIEGLTGHASRRIAELVGGDAALVEVSAEGEVRRAVARRASDGDRWVDEEGSADEWLEERAEGDRSRVRGWGDPFEAELGVWLLDGPAVEFDAPTSFERVEQLAPRLQGVVDRARAGARWSVVEVEGRSAVRVDGADGSRELVFVSADELARIRDALT